MIKYTLVCEIDHTFEGWFRNSDDFAAQCERKLVECPNCGSTEVRKALMAPAVTTSRKKAVAPVPEQAVAENNAGAVSHAPAPDKSSGPETSEKVPQVQVQQTAMIPPDIRQQELFEAFRRVRDKILETSENVGSDFALEARKMHYGETEERPIYGQSTREDAEELLDEGIAILPLPDVPDDKN